METPHGGGFYKFYFASLLFLLFIYLLFMNTEIQMKRQRWFISLHQNSTIAIIVTIATARNAVLNVYISLSDIL